LAGSGQRPFDAVDHLLRPVCAVQHDNERRQQGLVHNRMWCRLRGDTLLFLVAFVARRKPTSLGHYQRTVLSPLATVEERSRLFQHCKEWFCMFCRMGCSVWQCNSIQPYHIPHLLRSCARDFGTKASGMMPSTSLYCSYSKERYG
jgi:hypothetical protein